MIRQLKIYMKNVVSSSSIQRGHTNDSATKNLHLLVKILLIPVLKH